MSQLRAIVQKSGFLPPYTDLGRISKTLMIRPPSGLAVLDWQLANQETGLWGLWLSSHNRWHGWAIVNESGHVYSMQMEWGWAAYLHRRKGEDGLFFDLFVLDGKSNKVMRPTDQGQPNVETAALIHKDAGLFVDHLRKVAVFEMGQTI